jgi:hypothetical protein
MELSTLGKEASMKKVRLAQLIVRHQSAIIRMDPCAIKRRSTKFEDLERDCTELRKTFSDLVCFLSEKELMDEINGIKPADES